MWWYAAAPLAHLAAVTAALQALMLISAACNNKGNEAHAKQTFNDVGQLAWFKNMLDDTNPQVRCRGPALCLHPRPHPPDRVPRFAVPVRVSAGPGPRSVPDGAEEAAGVRRRAATTQRRHLLTARRYLPEDKISIDYFHVLALLGDTSLTVNPRKK